MPSMPPTARLVFVYNADSGFFNTAVDIGHKIFSPATYPCHLCELTHGYFSMHGAWKRFVEKLPVPCDFLHRDQFHQVYPDMDVALPAVFVEEGGQLRTCLHAAELAACADLDELEEKIKQSVPC